MNEHEFEPVPGLPEDLPVDEVILWQGAPDWRVLAGRVFRLRLLGGYFILLLAVRISSALLTGEALAPTLVSLALLTGLGLCAAGLFTLYAWLTARSTLYTVTSKRLVMRFGIAIQLTINLPFTRIQSAAVRAYRDGSGDIPLVLDDSHRVSYVVMWPHVRPWHFRHPEPMLRGLPDAKSVAEIVADTASGIVPAPPEPVIRPARHANNRQRVPLTLGEAT